MNVQITWNVEYVIIYIANLVVDYVVLKTLTLDKQDYKENHAACLHQLFCYVTAFNVSVEFTVEIVTNASGYPLDDGEVFAWVISHDALSYGTLIYIELISGPLAFANICPL